MKSTAKYEPLDAKPRVAVGVQWEHDRERLVQVRRPLSVSRGFGAWVGRNLGLQREARVNLDERGTAFWEQMDGERTLADIERGLRGRFGLNAQECHQAVVAFTRMLMTRGLICLELPESHPLRQEAKTHG